MLAVKAAADDVLARLVRVAFRIAELVQEARRQPPRFLRVVQGRAKEARRVIAVGFRETRSAIAAMVAVFDTSVPAWRKAIGNAGGEFQLSLALPFAMKLFAFLRSAKVGRPDEAVREPIALDEIGLVRNDARA